MADTETPLRLALRSHATAHGSENTAALIERIMSEYKGSGGPISPGKASAQELHAEMNHSTGIDPKQTNAPGSAGAEEPNPQVFKGFGGKTNSSEQVAGNDVTGDRQGAGPEAEPHGEGYATSKNAPGNTTRSNRPGPSPPDAKDDPHAAGLKTRGGGEAIRGTGVTGRNSPDESAQNYPDGSARSTAAGDSWTQARSKARAAFARARK
jgi:hypothetical protein